MKAIKYTVSVPFDAAEADASSVCPRCSSYITPRQTNGSVIVRVDPGWTPNGDGRWSYDDGWPYHADGHVINDPQQVRVRVHLLCFARQLTREARGKPNWPLWIDAPILRGCKALYRFADEHSFTIDCPKDTRTKPKTATLRERAEQIWPHEDWDALWPELSEWHKRNKRRRKA